MQMTRVRATSLLPVLLMQMGLVSLTKPVTFFGRRKSFDLLKEAIFRGSRLIALVNRYKKGAAMSSMALQAANGIPSKPGEEFEEDLMASRNKSEWSSFRRLVSAVVTTKILSDNTLPLRRVSDR